MINGIKRLLFLIFYHVLYWLFALVLLALLLITPADAIKQAHDNNQLYNIFVIAGCYFVTALIGVLIWASRIYTNKQVLGAIPKTWVPVEKGDVNKSVRLMIVAGLARSAAIAWDARPRIEKLPPIAVSAPDTRDAIARPSVESRSREYKRRRGVQVAEEESEMIVIPPKKPVWGDIAHPGWSSPTSPDLPNLQYITVIQELPHLIEARAVSLAPPDRESNSEPPLPDIRAVDVMQRPASTGLREYLSHLAEIGVMSDPSIASSFLTSYEYARFSMKALSESEFRELMKQFADLLRSMKSLSPTMLGSLDDAPPDPGSDVDDDANSVSTPRSPSLASSHSNLSRTGSEGTIRTAPSRRPPTRSSNNAPATPRSKKPISLRTPSQKSLAGIFAQSRRPYHGSSDSSISSRSGSIIKLSDTNEVTELPYTLTVPGVR